MAGAIIIVVLLVLFPLFVGLAGFVLSAGLGWLLDDDAKQRNEGSELVELNQ